MAVNALYRQVGRPGPILCHYRPVGVGRRCGAVFAHDKHVVLLSFGAFGHAFGIGWTFD